MEKRFFFLAIAGLFLVAVFFVVSQPVNKAPLVALNDSGGNELAKNESKGTIVRLETTNGTMKLRLFDDKAPITTTNFEKLLKSGFYDGTIFHRVIADFMIQGGDPTGTGTGGPGYTIKDEFSAELKHDKKGILSMANTGQPNTGGSQFFITLVPTPWLDGKHAVFGELIEGMNVLDAIGKIETNANDRPLVDVKIVKAVIEQ